MRDRLPLILSGTALVVSVLGVTPLGHAAYRAVVPNNSVGPRQLRKGAVTNEKLRGDAVTSGKVKNGSLRAVDFKAGQLPAGPTGPVGPKGDQGAKGDKGAKGDAGATTVVVRQGLVRTTPGPGASGIFFAQADCAAGERAVGGGVGLVSGSGSFNLHVSSSTPVPNTPGATPTGWRGGIYYDGPGITWSVWAICAKP
jgi:hypothetical protein